MSILPLNSNPATVLAEFQKAVTELAASSAQPLLDLPALRDQYSLAWDDDSGPGYSAALAFEVPQDGDYSLIASSSLSAAGRQTSGSYRLLLGLDTPQVLAGTAQPNGATIAVQDQAGLNSAQVQELQGSLDEKKPAVSIRLSDLNPGDVLSVRLESTSGDLKPVVCCGITATSRCAPPT